MKIPRTHLMSAAVLGCSLVGSAWSGDSAPGPEGRVGDRRAIEQVYWSHRIWPTANRGSKPDLATVLPDRVLRERVTDDLRKRAALERLWAQRITAAQVQAELDRMAARSRAPQVLKELFAALGNDPRRIAQGLAEPALVDRALRSRYAADRRFHEDARLRAERALSRADGAGDLKRLDGEYLEAIYLRRDESVPAPADPATEGVALDPSSWEGLLVRLAAAFDADGAATARPESLPLLATSGLAEEPDAFRVYRVLEAGKDRVRVASVAWPKRSFEAWWREAHTTQAPAARPVVGDFTLPALADTCTDDTWSAMITDSPYGREAHTAVWTGSEMIIWGGYSAIGPLNTGARYNPTTDTWVPTAIDASTPAARTAHTAVWTGSEMIVWGGGTFNSIYNALRSGGRYDPQTDSWQAVRDDDTSPTLRVNHAAVWAGSEMIIWGGGDGSCNCGYEKTGARYNPVSNTWSPTRADLTAPEARAAPTAVWTGNEMIVWGGFKKNPCCLAGHTDVQTGGRYDPLSDAWTLIDGGGVRSAHTAVWTGSEMIVWGGMFRVWDIRTSRDVTTMLQTGARYSPGANSWNPTAIVTATPTAQGGHTAVWTGSGMIVWGSGARNAGRYDPAQNAWSSVRTDLTSPGPRSGHTAVWTGSEMIVWGGQNKNSGGRYDPAQDTWLPTPVNAPFPSGIPPQGPAVWSGSEMIVWSSPSAAGRYDPATDHWAAVTSDNAPQARTFHTAVWTGTHMIVWGGNSGSAGLDSGGEYDPTNDQWTATAPTGAPAPRSGHTAVWTGSEMIVWGGYTCCTFYGTGGRYDPSTRLWTPTLANGTAPVGRYSHSAVWTGSEMIVWGGYNDLLPSPPYALNSGGRYRPETDKWVSTPASASGPDARYLHTAVWTGTEMIVWGGQGLPLGTTPLQVAGWAYSPAADSWRKTRDDATAPEGRWRHVAAWTGREMIVWGGARDNTYVGMLDTGARYDPAADEWTATRADATTPLRRDDAASVWTGSTMLVWGGLGPFAQSLNTGGAYCAAACDMATYYRDGDADGHGDPGQQLEACGVPSGYAPTGDDCNDADTGNWGTPGEARDLMLTDPTALQWTPPVLPGGSLLQYDLVRSNSSRDFVTTAACLASGSPGTTANDPDMPARGVIFYYLARAINGCPLGQGVLGTSSNGVPIAGRSCP